MRNNKRGIVDANDRPFFFSPFLFSNRRDSANCKSWMDGVEARRLRTWRLNGHCWENAPRTQKTNSRHRANPKPKTEYHPSLSLSRIMGMCIYIYMDRGLAVTVRATSEIHSPQLSQELGY